MRCSRLAGVGGGSSLAPSLSSMFHYSKKLLRLLQAQGLSGACPALGGSPSSSLPPWLSLTLDRSHQSLNCDTGGSSLLPCHSRDPGLWSTGSHVSMAGWELRVLCYLGVST